MKEKCFSLILFITVAIVTLAQTNPVLKKQTLHGIVKNEKNKAVQNASVILKGEENAIPAIFLAEDFLESDRAEARVGSD